MDPIVLGGILGGTGVFFVTQEEHRSSLRPYIIGSVGSGWGGWMATQIWNYPSTMNILLCSVVGVIVFDHFLML